MPPFVSAAALVVEGDRILMVRDPIRREAVLPGGHLKWRETPLQAVVREVAEETGYHVRAGRLLGAFAGEEWLNDPGIVRLIYEADVLGGTLVPSAEGTPEWLPLTEVTSEDTRDAAVVRAWLAQQSV